MLDRGRRSRVRIFERSAALRRELVRAVLRAGFDAESDDVVPDWDGLDERARPALAVVDLDTPGARDWLARPEARRRTLFLVGDPQVGDGLRRRFGFELDLLIKPFPVESLEAKLVARGDAERKESEFRLEPWLDTRDPLFARTLERAWQLAQTSSSVCIEGELGTGRRALAAAIHARSPRAGEPLVLLEGAGLSDRAGDGFESALEARIASASDGSLVVVEPGEWPLRIQLALQRGLRAFAENPGPRCLALCSGSLDAQAREGRLDAELHYRLSGPTLHVPALRARTADQAPLWHASARRMARELGRVLPPLEPELFARFAREGFPGNRLGLEHRLRQALLSAPDAPAASETAQIDGPRPSENPSRFDLRTLERETIVRALAHAKGNRTHASRALGISVRTLRNKIHEYALR